MLGILFHIISDGIVLGIVYLRQYSIIEILNNVGKVPIEGVLKHIVNLRLLGCKARMMDSAL